MSVTKKLVTTEFGVESATNFALTFSSNTDQYFVFAGKHIPYPNTDSNITEPDNSISEKTTELYNNMMFAKKVANTDVNLMIDKKLWTQGTVYDEYTHEDTSLLTKDFYVVVDDTSEFNVYKCLFNNGSANSTAAPTRTGSAADLEPIVTADGYVWKYMWTITKTEYEKFATKNYVPVIANTSVIDNAVPGSVEVIKVINGGAGYDNYIQNGVFDTGEIQIGGDPTKYGAPSSASAVDDFYRGCVMRITSGAGINEYRRVVAYSGSGVTKVYTLDSGFTNVPSVNDTYEILPYIYVWGDGNETEAAEAIAVINATSNSIHSVEILASGAGYRTGVIEPSTFPADIPITPSTGQITIPDIIQLDSDFVQANLYPIISPPYGHGGNPWLELGANKVCVYTKFSNTENGVFPTENDFRQIGLIKNPAYANVTLSLDTNSITGSFTVGEEVYKYNPTKLYGTYAMAINTNVLEKENLGLISSTITILNGGTGYDSTANNQLVFDNTGTGGTGAVATFANDVSGVITSVTVTDQGSGYVTVPSVSVNPTAAAGGSNAQFSVALANPQETELDKSLQVGDYVIVSNGSSKFVSSINTVTNASSVVTTSNTAFLLANSTVSKLEFTSSSNVKGSTSSTIVLTNAIGTWVSGDTIVGVTSGATAAITGATVNDRATSTFDRAMQLTRLIGDYTVGGTSFIEDEAITQDTVIPLFQGTGYLHHIEINGGTDDDILYVSNKSGQFNLDPDGNEIIRGSSSTSTLENLSAKYPGEFVVDSGKVLYYENLDPIKRDGTKSETVKLIFEF